MEYRRTNQMRDHAKDRLQVKVAGISALFAASVLAAMAFHFTFGNVVAPILAKFVLVGVSVACIGPLLRFSWYAMQHLRLTRVAKP